MSFVGGSLPGSEEISYKFSIPGSGDLAGGGFTATTDVTPTVNVQNVTVVGEGNQVSQFAFFAGVTNPSGDNITQCAFFDGAGDNGYISFGGAAQADSQWNVVSAANLGSVTYVGGNQAGSESLYVDAHDATTGLWTALGHLTAATT